MVIGDFRRKVILERYLQTKKGSCKLSRIHCQDLLDALPVNRFRPSAHSKTLLVGGYLKVKHARNFFSL